ncbi:MAG: tetratricopeptide repeat-containing protein [Chloroflexota bacterium]|nr:tetratricopeptide repeat-containing protein [Chloroflexota bacterium]
MPELGGSAASRRNVWHSGWAFHNQGLWDEAARRYRDSLELAAEVGDRFLTAGVVMSVAGLHASQGEFQRGLSLAAAAGAALAASGVPVPPVYQALFDRWLEPAVRAAGSEVADRLWQAGHTMSLTKAVAAALADSQ